MEWPVDTPHFGRHTPRTQRLTDSTSLVHTGLGLADPTDTLITEGPDRLVLRSKANPETDHQSALPRHTAKATTGSGPPHASLFTAWHIRYSRGTNSPKRSPRYVYRSDLAPQIKPLRQTTLGYRVTNAPHRARDPLKQTSSIRRRAPTRFQRRRTKTTQREDH